MQLRFYILLALAICGSAVATPAHKAVSRGNEAFESGNFDRALRHYEEADKDSPEAAEVAFNKGAALYKKNDFPAAAEAFQSAAIQTDDPKLGGLAKYNLGNSTFRQAESQTDIKQAIESCKVSIGQYQDALQLDPNLKNAAENLEVARLRLKALMDEQQRQQSQDQNQDDQNQDQEEQNQDSSDQSNQSDSSEQQQQQDSENQDSENQQQQNEGGEEEQQQQGDEGEEEQQQQQEQQGEDGEEEEQQPQEGEEDKESGEEQQFRPEMVNAEARSILDEEKDRKDKRRIRVRVGGQPVDKDW